MQKSRKKTRSWFSHAINSDNKSKKLVFSCCRSIGGAQVYAKALEKNTRLFTVRDRKHYISGAAGDYLIVRMDDPSDIYILSRERFEERYESLT